VRGGNGYWYFNRSSGKNRLIYLCSVLEKGNENNSFIHSTKILHQKLRGEIRVENNKSLIKVIDDYILRLRDEGESNKRGVERTKGTVGNIITQLGKFREYVVNNPIGIKDVSKDSFRDYISVYINHLLDENLKPSSIQTNLVRLRQFLNDLVHPPTGKPIIKYHPITSVFMKTQFSINNRTKIQPNFYSEKKYSDLLEICSKEVRRSWREFINSGIRPPKSEIVYFTSILQLIYGFRIGELLSTYLSIGKYEKYETDKKRGYSYLEETSRNGYLFQIYWKKKRGSVNVDFDVYSWVEPPEGVPHKKEFQKENHQKPTFTTNIIDVMKTLFSDDKSLLPFSYDTIRSSFRKKLLEKFGMDKIGIKTPHDLRDMMINYELHTKKTSFVDLSQMTRNNLQTIEKYYLHTSKELSITQSQKLNTRNRLVEVRGSINSNEGGDTKG
jgi:integrase